MSKYVLSWADDTDGINLTVSVHDTLEDAQKVMFGYWDALLELFELPEGTTEFEFSNESGNVGDTWLSYRNECGYGDEVTITEVTA